MANIAKINGAVVAVDEKQTSELLKPLSRDILLFSTKIAGIYTLHDRQPVLSLKEGAELTFLREESKYEENRIAILDGNGAKVGYVPETDAVIFARLMDAGKYLFARTKSLTITHGMPMVQIDIFLRDF